MAGADNDTLFGTGLDLSGDSTVTNKLNVNGNIYFGNDNGNPQAGLPTSVNDTIGYIGGEGSGRFENRRWLTPFVVDASSSEGSRGTYQTIGAALTAAVSAGGNQEIFIRPGTYTEDLTFVDGIRVTGFIGDEKDSIVTIVGKSSIASGKAVASGIRFETNSDYCISATGTGNFELTNCTVVGSDNDAIQHTSSGLTTMRNSGGGVSDGFKLLTQTAGNTAFRDCSFSGGNGTVNTVADGLCVIANCSMGNFPLSVSGSGAAQYNNSQAMCGTNNVTALTTAGTGTSSIVNSNIDSGSASTVSIGSGTIVEIYNTSLRSTNTNTVTGAGTLQYASLVLSSTSTAINPTTATKRGIYAGNILDSSSSPVVIQQKRSSTSALTINSTALPWDDTIPQQTEGDEILTVSITPTSSSSVLVVEATCMGAIDGVERKMGMAIFRDSTASAISATALNASADSSVSDYAMSGSIKTFVSAGSTSSTTFKLRVGNENGAGSSVNGYDSGRIYGGVANTSIFVTEYSA